MKKFTIIMVFVLLICLVFSCALVGCKEKEEMPEENENLIVAIYEPNPLSSSVSSNNLENTVALLYVMLIKNGFKTFSVKLIENNTKIQVSVPDEGNARAFLDWVSRPMSFEYRKEGRDEELKSNPYVTNNDLQSASVSTDSHGSFVVALKFNEEGTKKFEAATRERLNKSINIWLNGEWVMGPTVGFVISNGEATITGNYSYEEANELATRIQVGAMKVRLQLVDITYPEVALA